MPYPKWLRSSQALAAVLFLAYLLVGFVLYSDYGISWDEPAQREIGWVNYNYIFSDDPTLLTYIYHYYGPIFELFLIFVEILFKPQTTQEIYFLRHLFTFLLFYVGAVTFYFLARRSFRRPATALLAVLALILSPKVFENAFYNTKDMPCLVFFIISVYTLFVYLDRRSWWSLAVHGAASGALLTTRVTGILIPAVTIAYLAIELVEKDSRLAHRAARTLSKILLYGAATAGFVVLIWPILWSDPLGNFALALREMKHYNWFMPVRFAGQAVMSDELPWYYIPVWIAITTPPLYSLLFLTGTSWSVIDLWLHRDRLLNDQKKKLVILCWFFGPPLAIILLDSIVYDSWRHLLFIYPAFLLLAFWGWEKLFDLAWARWGSRHPVSYVLPGVLALAFLTVTFAMIRLHPYEQLYFNGLAGKNLADVQPRYDLDYWGLSYRAGLEYIAQTDSNPQVRVAVETGPGVYNALILPPEHQRRIVYVKDEQEAVYYINNYRWQMTVPYTEEVYSVVVDGAKILSVFKVPQN